MTQPQPHARAVELIDAARVALNVYLDIEVATIETDVWDLVHQRALPTELAERDVAFAIGTFFEEMADPSADHVVADAGRFYVGRRDGDEDVGEYMTIDRKSVFLTQDDCERFTVAGELAGKLEVMIEDRLPDLPEGEFQYLLDRIGCGELVAYRRARVGCLYGSGVAA